MKNEILLIEDDRDIREALSELIHDEGYEVRTAENGLKGLERLQEGKLPDLILVDLMMPTMSGGEFILKARELLKDKVMPIIVMSALNNAEARATELGASGHLKKPLALEELCTMVSKFCH